MGKYVLSDRDRSELERLAHQHHVWSDVTSRLYARAGLLEMDKILEPGCGPGYSIKDLSEGEAEEIWGIDTSELFIARLSEWAQRHGGSRRIEAVLGDIAEVPLPENYFDGCFCRWVLMFLPSVDRVVRKIFKALKPGGVLACMEYGPFLDISISPSSRHFDTIYRAVYRLITDWGGNPDIGLQLPDMLTRVGFEHVDVKSVSQSGKPGSPLWNWIEATGPNHTNLVGQGLIDAEQLEAYNKHMMAARKNENAVFTAPTLQVIVARK